MKPEIRIYLAGPNVFRAKNDTYFDDIKMALRDLGDKFDVNVTGVSPQINSKYPNKIFDGCIALLDTCDGVLADVRPFRGVSADVGTSWEMGYAYAKGIPIVSYNIPTDDYKYRLGPLTAQDIFPEVEDFGLPDNLMLFQSVEVNEPYCAGEGAEALLTIIIATKEMRLKI